MLNIDVFLWHCIYCYLGKASYESFNRYIFNDVRGMYREAFAKILKVNDMVNDFYYPICSPAF